MNVTCPVCNQSNASESRSCSKCGSLLLPPHLSNTQPRAGTGKGTALVVVIIVVAVIGFARGCAPSESSTKTDPAKTESSNRMQPVDTPNLWLTSENTSPMDGLRTIVLSRKAVNSYRSWLQTITPELEVQCYSKGRPDVLVDIGAAASVEYDTDSHTVRVKLDEGSPNSQHWSKSKDDKALFSPNPTALLATLTKHSSMMFEFDPFNTSSKADVQFDLSGLKESLAKYPECRAK